MINIFEDYPREIATPKRILVRSKSEFFKYINQNIFLTDIYTTLYGFQKIEQNNGRERPDYESCIVRYVWFDFDVEKYNSGEECWSDVKKFHKHLMSEYTKHIVTFTGGGFHVFIITEPISENKRDLIYNCQFHFMNKLNLNIDTQGMGDISRIVRVPNTYNFKRGRFCIPLHEDDFSLTYKQIWDKASKQQFGIEIFGNKLLNLEKFANMNGGTIFQRIRMKIQFDIEQIKKIKVKNVDFPLCLKVILKKHQEWVDQTNNWRERYLLILWMREKGYSLEECIAFLKKHLTPAEFRHCVAEERQPFYLYSRRDLMFPTCDKIKKMMLCPVEGYCDKNHLYLR